MSVSGGDRPTVDRTDMGNGEVRPAGGGSSPCAASAAPDGVDRALGSSIRALLDASPIGVYVVDSEFRIAYVNAVARPVFGEIPGLVGRGFGEVIHTLWPEPYAGEVEARFRRTLETGEAFVMNELAEERRDRRAVEYYEWRIDRIPLADGRHGVVCNFQDVSSRVRARSEVAWSEERYRTLFNSIDEGFCVIDVIFDDAGRAVDYRFLETNPAFDRQSGLSVAVGKRMRELAPAHEQHWFETYGEVVRTGEAVRFVNEAKALIGRWFDVYAFRLGGPGSTKVAALFRDITGRKRAEDAIGRHRDELGALVRERTAELERSATQLRLAERLASIGTLAAGIGHDLGNLMLPVRERLESLAEGGLTAEQASDVRSITRAVEYLGDIVQGLRLLAQDPEPGSGEGDLDLGAWWGEVEPILRNAVARNIELRGEMPGAGVRARIGRAALTQAVFNLVQNASTAISGRDGGCQGGRITVRVETGPGGQGPEGEGGSVRLSVEDNGPGMTEEVRRRCVEPFFTTRTRGMSTGLGLALVQGIITRAGGQMEITTRLGSGSGSTFVLSIPRVREGAEARFVCNAFVVVRDARRAAFIMSELRAAGAAARHVEAPWFAGVGGTGGVGGEGELVVAESGTAGADAALAYAREGGHAVVMGVRGEEIGHPRIRTVREGAPVAVLREALLAGVAACTELRGGAGDRRRGAGVLPGAHRPG